MKPAQTKPAVGAFISYSSKDSTLAEALKKTVEGDGISCFYAPLSLQAMQVWEEHLKLEIETADLILLLYTESAANSDQVYKEVAYAHSLGKDIWLLKDRRVGISDRFGKIEIGARYHAFLLEPDVEAATFREVRTQIDRRFGRQEQPKLGHIDHEDNPYPGKPYTANDQDFFFGRDAECNQLLADIVDGEERIFFVYGPSGAGKSSLIDAGLRRLLSKKWWFSEKIEPSLERPEFMALDMWRLAERQVYGDGVLPERSPAQLVPDLLKAIEAANKPGYVFWFDHVERLLTLEDKFIYMFFRIAWDLIQRNRNIRILITFRQEALSQAESHAKREVPDGAWRKWVLRLLSRNGAYRSVVDPPRFRNGVTIGADLAGVLVDELARVEYEDRNGEKIVTVNPVSLQLVCRRLWTTGKPGLSSITPGDLRTTENGLQADVHQFVKNALTNHLEDAIARIALNLKGGNLEQKKELIRLGLLQFVSEDRRRQQLKAESDGKWTRVGRLQGEIIDELYEEKLLQRTDIGLAVPDYRYELVHDSLAEAISRYKEKVDLLRTLNTLESAVRAGWHEKTGLAGCFNRNTDLLADLEPARSEETGFFDREREFLFRCALGNQRGIAKRPISIEGWACLLAAVNVTTFAAVLKEALTPGAAEESVQRDAICLLMQKQIRDFLTLQQQKDLGDLVRAAALDGTDEVQPTACVAVCELRDPPGAMELFGLLKDGALQAKTSSALGWVRHAADRREIPDLEACAAFERLWERNIFGTSHPDPHATMVAADDPFLWLDVLRGDHGDCIYRDRRRARIRTDGFSGRGAHFGRQERRLGERPVSWDCWRRLLGNRYFCCSHVLLGHFERGPGFAKTPRLDSGCIRCLPGRISSRRRASVCRWIRLPARISLSCRVAGTVR